MALFLLLTINYLYTDCMREHYPILEGAADCRYNTFRIIDEIVGEGGQSMTIQNLRYVIEVANTRSFSQAARNLFISQSALSSSVKDVEQELGIQIFLRSNRGVRLTPAGEDCLKYCREIVERTDYLLGKYKTGERQHLYFSVSAQHLPIAVRTFDELLLSIPVGSYDLSIREVGTAQMLRDVSNGKSELGVGSFHAEQLKLIKRAFGSYDLKFSQLAELNTYVFVRTRHPLAKKPILKTADLNDYPFVTYDDEDSPDYYSEESIFFKPFRKTIHVQDRATKMSVIRSSDAFSIGIDLPNFNRDVYFHNSETELVAIPFGDQIAPVKVGVLQKSGFETSMIADQYIELLRKHIDLLILPGRE